MTRISLSDNGVDEDPTRSLFEAIHMILKQAEPYGLQIECLAQFIEDCQSPYWDGDYMLSASGALYDWDI